MTRTERDRRFAGLRQIGCICCLQIDAAIMCGPRVEVHHLLTGGNAGQRRLGDEHTVSLASWHHRGDPPPGYTATEAEAIWGPSLARNSRKFREVFGGDAELLRITNERLEAL